MSPSDDPIAPLDSLPPILSRMKNLSTFSLSVSPEGNWSSTHDFTVPVLLALPENCVNLELNNDELLVLKPGQTIHQCEVLSRILPRLCHARLRLRSACPSIFGSHFAPDGSAIIHSQPPICSHLESLVIHHTRPFDGPAHCHYLIDPAISSRTMAPLINSMNKFAHQASLPNLKQMWFTCGELRCRVASCLTSIRRDFANKKSLAIPWNLLRPIDNRKLATVRMPGRELIMTDYDAFSDFIDEQSWKTTVLGSRLPSATLETPAEAGRHTILPLSAMSVSELCSLYPNAGCDLWDQESFMGTQLVWPIEQEGIMDRMPLILDCPPGWRHDDSAEFGFVRDEDALA